MARLAVARSCQHPGDMMNMSIKPQAFLFSLLLGVALALVACSSGREQQPDVSLRVLSLEYRGDVIEGYRGESCWTPRGQQERKCLAAGRWKDVDTYTDVASGETLTVRIAPDTTPTQLSVYVVTEPGEVAGDFTILPRGSSSFGLQEGPGSYKVRVTAQWAEDEVEVNYGFGLRIQGVPELKSECASTVVGGILGIVLDSLEDPDRTAFEAVNHSGCRFNKEIAEVRLILNADGAEPYTETFQLKPPSLIVGFPIPEDVSSIKSGGPLPHGQYLRRIVAISVDGEEREFVSGSVGGLVKLAGGSPQTDMAISFPQHHEERQTYTTALPEHIEGRIQIYRGCIYIRNGEIPVWPSNFTLRSDNGRVQILDESGNVVAADGQKVVLAGHEVKADDPQGREVNRSLPLACPPGNIWIVGDEISEMKAEANLPVVPLQGSSLLFPRQVPGHWRDDLSISTENDLILEGDCLRVDDDKRHMIIWPPLFRPHMQDGVIEVRDGEGRTVARVGDRLHITGFGSELMRPHYADRCPGPYWTVGRIVEGP